MSNRQRYPIEKGSKSMTYAFQSGVHLHSNLSKVVRNQLRKTKQQILERRMDRARKLLAPDILEPHGRNRRGTGATRRSTACPRQAL